MTIVDPNAASGPVDVFCARVCVFCFQLLEARALPQGSRSRPQILAPSFLRLLGSNHTTTTTTQPAVDGRERQRQQLERG